MTSRQAPDPQTPGGKQARARASKDHPGQEAPPPVRSSAARSLREASGHDVARDAVGPSRVAGRTTTQRPDRATQDAWVARLQDRDREALREVVAAFGERLTAVVSGVLRDRDAVDDVVQETFAKAWYRIHAFQGGSSLYTWLYRVAVNGAKDYIKSRRRRPAGSFDELPGRASLPDERLPQMEGIERRELRLRVRAAIARLPAPFREVLALREIEGMSYNDIAEALALSLGTVESRLFRARQRLRELLDEGGATLTSAPGANPAPGAKPAPGRTSS